jgi:preprotein translocase subunit SecE
MAKTKNGSGASSNATKKPAAALRMEDLPKAPRVSVAQYVRNIRIELKKITWPSRKETLATTLAVFVMVLIASVFFLLVDQIFFRAISALLGATF